MRAILHFVKKEFIQFKRDPRMYSLVLFSPVIQLTLLGFAANLDIDKVRTVIYEH